MDRRQELAPTLTTAHLEWTEASVSGRLAAASWADGGPGELATGQRREEVLVGGVERVCDGQHDEATIDGAQDDRRSSRRAGDVADLGVCLVVGDLDAVGDTEDAHGPVAGVVIHGVRVVVRKESLHGESALGFARDQRVDRLARLQVEQVEAAAGGRRVQSVLAVTRARAVPAHDRAHERFLLHVPNVGLLVVDQCNLGGDNNINNTFSTYADIR